MTSSTSFSQLPFYKCSEEQVKKIFHELGNMLAVKYISKSPKEFSDADRRVQNHGVFWNIPISSSDKTSCWSIVWAYRLCKSSDLQAMEQNRKVFIAALHPFYPCYGYESYAETPEELVREFDSMAQKIWDRGIKEMSKYRRDHYEPYIEERDEPTYELSRKTHKGNLQILRKFRSWIAKRTRSFLSKMHLIFAHIGSNI